METSQEYVRRSGHVTWPGMAATPEMVKAGTPPAIVIPPVSRHGNSEQTCAAATDVRELPIQGESSDHRAILLVRGRKKGGTTSARRPLRTAGPFCTQWNILEEDHHVSR